MTDSSYTHIALIVDSSGSMYGIHEDMDGGIKTLLNDQKELPGKLLVDVTTFSSFTRAVHQDVIADHVHFPIIKPSGGTALLDAVGNTVQGLGERLALLPEDERPGKVIVAVVTDGEENSSTEWDKARVQALVKTQETDYSWEFLFLGANIDSATVGGGLGFRQTLNYAPTASGSAGAARSMSAYMTTSRLGGDAVLTDDES